jgi:hypothetical protein
MRTILLEDASASLAALIGFAARSLPDPVRFLPDPRAPPAAETFQRLALFYPPRAMV